MVLACGRFARWWLVWPLARILVLGIRGLGTSRCRVAVVPSLGYPVGVWQNTCMWCSGSTQSRPCCIGGKLHRWLWSCLILPVSGVFVFLQSTWKFPRGRVVVCLGHVSRAPGVSLVMAPPTCHVWKTILRVVRVCCVLGEGWMRVAFFAVPP